MIYRLSYCQAIGVVMAAAALARGYGIAAIIFKLLASVSIFKCSSSAGRLITITAAAASGEVLGGLEVGIVSLLILSTPSDFSFSVSSSVPVLMGQLIVSSMSARLWYNQQILTPFYLAAAALSCYICLTYNYIYKQTLILDDAVDESRDLKDNLSSLGNQLKFLEHTRGSISAHRSKSMETKLRHMFPGRLNSSRTNTDSIKLGSQRHMELSSRFEDKYGQFQSEENMLMSLESEQDSEGAMSSGDLKDFSDRRSSQDLSGEDVDTLVTSVLSKEYILWSDRKHKKPAIANDKFILMLTQSRDVKLRSEGRHFRIGQNHLRTTAEENPELSEIFDRLCEWDFDSFGLIKATAEPLKEVSTYIFAALNLNEQFGISKDSLENFLTRVERSYHKDNFYHNSLHATDVLNSVYFLLYSGVHRSGQFLELEVLSLICSALAHDMGHPGVNNAFLINSQDPLSLAYNDKSVLENMHCCSMFTILRRPDSNILRTLSSSDFVSFRKLSVALILATDLQRHFEKVAEFKAALDKDASLETPEFRMLVLEICLKCADIGHCAKELELHKRWTTLLSQEFFRQGDREKDLGLPLSPLCMRENVVLSKSQVSFINAFVQPIYMQWGELVKRTSPEEEKEGEPVTANICLDRIKENLSFWESETFRLENGLPVFEIEVCQPPLLTVVAKA